MLINLRKLFVVLVLSIFFNAVAFSQNATQTTEISAIRDVLNLTQPGMVVGVIIPSPLAGLYEVSIQGGQMLYASADAKFFIPGELYAVQAEGLVNLSEQTRNVNRVAQLAALDESDMIIYEAEGKRKATLTVFTDVDCPYCQKLHGEVPQLNEMGIAVRYLGFPRTGLNTETHIKMVSIWCSEDRHILFTSAKRGGGIPYTDCINPIANQYHLGKEFRVTGTPALVLEDGTLLPGYVPAETLAGYLLGNP